MPANTDYLSADTTAFSNLSLYGSGGLRTSRVSSSNTAIFAAVWASDVSCSRITATSRVSTPILDVSGGATLSAGSADFRTNTVVISLDTRANASGMTTGQLRLVFQASGVSLMYSSGKTQYTVGESATSLAQS